MSLAVAPFTTVTSITTSTALYTVASATVPTFARDLVITSSRCKHPIRRGRSCGDRRIDNGFFHGSPRAVRIAGGFRQPWHSPHGYLRNQCRDG